MTQGQTTWTRRRLLGWGAGAAAGLSAWLLRPGQAWADDDVGWKVIASESGVTIWNRLDPGREVPVFKGIGNVDASIFEVLAVLDDVSLHPSWMANCSQARIIKQINEFDRVIYNRTDAPWPVSDRDVVLACTVEASLSKAEVICSFAGTATALQPPLNGVVRMPRLRGHYKLAALDERRTRVTYQIDADPGGHLPDWLVERTTRNLPLQTVVGLRRQVARTRGKYDSFVSKYDTRRGGAVPPQFLK